MHLIKFMSILIEISSKVILNVLILHVTSEVKSLQLVLHKIIQFSDSSRRFRLISYTPLQYGHVIGYIC